MQHSRSPATSELRARDSRSWSTGRSVVGRFVTTRHARTCVERVVATGIRACRYLRAGGAATIGRFVLLVYLHFAGESHVRVVHWGFASPH